MVIVLTQGATFGSWLFTEWQNVTHECRSLATLRSRAHALSTGTVDMQYAGNATDDNARKSWSLPASLKTRL